MLINDLGTFQIVLYEGSGANPMDAGASFSLVMQLLDRGYSVNRAAAGGAPTSASEGRLLVLGDFGGNPPVLEDAAGETEIGTRDISGMDEAAILDAVEAFRGERGINQPSGTPGAEKSWKPWFPVIDYDRCTNCMQCLSFCLFDVYGVDDEKKIQVQNNDNCKTNCPACSRVCPEVAIMFPKYSGGPINGEEVKEDDLKREKMKVDISSLLGGDIYSSLRTRSEAAKSRFSKERSPDKALTERKKCLTKLQQDGMIPAEVLENLPSPEEIMRRAEEAAAKGRAALADQGNP